MGLTLVPVSCRRGYIYYLAALLMEPRRIALGVAQPVVLGRIGELALSGRSSAVQVGRVITWFLPLSMVLLWLEGQLQPEWLLLGLFALLYGVGNGALTIVRGAVPAEIFGRTHYGAISGALNAPAMIAGAAAPFIASVLLDALGSYSRVVLVLMAAGALLFAAATRRAQR